MKTKTLTYTLVSIIGIFISLGFSSSSKKKPGKYVFIPAGSAVIDEKAISIDAFWMSP